MEQTLPEGILEDLFDDFLRFFFDNADEVFDMTRPFEFLDKELEQIFPTNQDEFYPKYVDKLVKVFTKEGTEEWILVHVEVQGSRDKEFGKRMFTYYYRILDKYDKEITAVAIFTDTNKKFKPRLYERKFMKTNLLFEFNTYKVLEQDSQKLAESDNPFALVILTAFTAIKKGKITQEELFDLKIDLARLMLSRQIHKDKIRGMMNFLKLYVRFGNNENLSKFDEVIDDLKNKPKKTMGIEEFVLDRERRVGRKEGESKAYQEKDTLFVKNLLKKLTLSDEQIVDIAGVPLEFVQKIRKKLKK
jgi:hypothetical protein